MDNATEKKFWVYILQCENGNFYTGYTKNLDRQFEAQLNGSARCKYTRSFLSLRIAQSWEVSDELHAKKFEIMIKKLDQQNKVLLIDNPDLLSSL